MTYVYVIAPASSGPCKIGCASKPEHRLRALQTGSADRLFVFATCFVGTAAKRLESEVHGRESQRRLHGEWFRMTVGEAAAAVQAASRRLGIVQTNGFGQVIHQPVVPNAPFVPAMAEAQQ